MTSPSKLNKAIALILLGILLLFMLLVVFVPNLPFLFSGGRTVLFVILLCFSGNDIYRTFRSPAGNTFIRSLSIASIVCMIVWMVAITITSSSAVGILISTCALPLSLVLSMMAQRRLQERERHRA